MKKLLKKAFLTVLVFSLVFLPIPIYINAASPVTYLAVSDSTLVVGDTFTVTVIFSLPDNAYGVSANLRYSSSHFEYVSGENANLIGMGVVEMVAMGNDKNYYFNLNFKVIGAGNAELILRDCLFADLNNEYQATGSSVALKVDKSANQSIPDIVNISYFTTNSVALIETNGCEYSIDGVNWQDSAYFGNLNSNQQYSFYQRYKETEECYASANSNAKTFATGSRDNNIKGDVNQDSYIDVSDLALLKKIIAKINEPNSMLCIAPDVDKSGDIANAADLALLKKTIAKLV